MLLLSEKIRFTERCESALKEGGSALKNLVEYLETQRARYRGLEDAGDKLTALKARGLLLDTVHHLEIARNLLNVTQREESTVWTWQRQLRSYRTVRFSSIQLILFLLYFISTLLFLELTSDTKKMTFYVDKNSIYFLTLRKRVSRQ